MRRQLTAGTQGGRDGTATQRALYCTFCTKANCTAHAISFWPMLQTGLLRPPFTKPLPAYVAVAFQVCPLLRGVCKSGNCYLSLQLR